MSHRKEARSDPLLEIAEVKKSYRSGRALVRAVDGVSLGIAPGERLGLVGESGCGKSTLARCAVRLESPDSGSVRFGGIEIAQSGEGELRSLRRRFQMVFQDPWTSLDPRQTIGAAIEEGLAIHRQGNSRERRLAARAMLARVGLEPDWGVRYPHELSGGQRQRVAIARALVLEPELLILDEPVSALDVTVQARILELLDELRRSLRLAWLFISHDLAVVQGASDRVAVMHRGRIVEIAPPIKLFASPLHPYTRHLVRAARDREVRGAGAAERTTAEIDPTTTTTGCSFRLRCPLAVDRCRVDEPALTAAPQEGRLVACHEVESLRDGLPPRAGEPASPD